MITWPEIDTQFPEEERRQHDCLNCRDKPKWKNGKGICGSNNGFVMMFKSNPYKDCEHWKKEA